MSDNDDKSPRRRGPRPGHHWSHGEHAKEIAAGISRAYRSRADDQPSAELAALRDVISALAAETGGERPGDPQKIKALVDDGVRAINAGLSRLADSAQAAADGATPNGDRLFDPVAFGAQVQTHVSVRGTSLNQMAKDISVSYSTLHAIAHGRTPSIETYLRILRWMNPGGRRGR